MKTRRNHNEYEPMEPDESDLVTYDHRTVYQYGKVAFLVPENRDFARRCQAFMRARQFWPNVWWISDHGNTHLVNLAI